MTPPFPGLTEVPAPLTRTGFRRLRFPMLVDVLLILVGLIVLVTPGHLTWTYVAWLLVKIAINVVALNLEVRLTIWKLERAL